MYIYRYIHTCIYIYIHTHTHTYMKSQPERHITQGMHINTNTGHAYQGWVVVRSCPGFPAPFWVSKHLLVWMQRPNIAFPGVHTWYKFIPTICKYTQTSSCMAAASEISLFLAYMHAGTSVKMYAHNIYIHINIILYDCSIRIYHMCMRVPHIYVCLNAKICT
jgi:hypothetical protein